MDITSESRVGDIAAAHPAATRVFSRHGIDFCCAGGRTLSESCEKKAIDADAVLAEIRKEGEANDQPNRWADASPQELVEHIIAAYHEPLREELPRLESMARKVARVHGEKQPGTLDELSRVVTELRGELERHMQEEERDLFPGIADHGVGEETRLESLEHDHSEAGAALERVRRLTDDYRLPAEACATWAGLWLGLEELERTMHEHIHLENNILFPRARRAVSSQVGSA